MGRGKKSVVGKDSGVFTRRTEPRGYWGPVVE